MADPVKSRALSAEQSLLYGSGGDVFQVTLHEPDAASMALRESVVQDIWRFQRFRNADLRTFSGQPLQIVEPGRTNTDSGPDFLGARLVIGDTVWNGNVEVHLSSSGWNLHGHDADSNYNNVILHVVLQGDVFTGKLAHEDGSPLEELVLMPLLNDSLRNLLYRFYSDDAGDFPCAAYWQDVPPAFRRSVLQKLGARRFQDRSAAFASRYLQLPDLDEVLHEEVFAALGFSKNTEAMRALARRLPRSIIHRIEDPLDLEAVHLGTAGLLPAPRLLLETDGETADYAMMLIDRFEYLIRSFPILPMVPNQWTFFRLRPANFPSLRIAQAAALMQPNRPLRRDPTGHLLAAAEGDARREWPALLETDLHPFWKTHVRLHRRCKPHNPAIGEERRSDIVTNVFAPFAVFAAEALGKPLSEEKISALLKSLPPERDEVTRMYTSGGFAPANVVESQGIHELHRNWCRRARCMACEIGIRVLGNKQG